jgi:enoyl-CoA hydratase/carnithine racemase
MNTIRFERREGIGSIVLANPPFNRVDKEYSSLLHEAVHAASESDIRVLLVRAEGPNFSLGGEVREWPGKDVNWFRTFVAEVNASYRAIEALRVPTVAAVRGLAFGGGFELALACDFLIASETAVFRCVEVTTAMLPIAGALQRLAERVGRARASRFSMLGEPIPGAQAGALGIATHVVPDTQLESEADALARRLASGPTRSYAATRTLLKAWSSGGVTAADAVMLDVTMDLYDGSDAQRGFANTAKAFDANVEPPEMVFDGK